MAVWSGGEKLASWFREMVAKVATPATLRVGILEQAWYEDGTTVAEAALINEYGGTINIPARESSPRETTIYRHVDKDGKFTNGGRFVKKNQSNFASSHAVRPHIIPAHQINIPARPFFRQMIAKHKPEWSGELGKVLKTKQYHSKAALRELGHMLEAQLIETIQTGDFVPNAPSTIARKGSEKPLIDTGLLQESITSEVV